MEGRDYTCANPDAIFHGSPRTLQECEQRFFAGYTGITMKPSECEPTECCLQAAFQDIKLCNEIQTQMGGEYLGCLLIDPNAPYSCDCPRVGKDFDKLLNFDEETCIQSILNENSLIIDSFIQGIINGN
jgi:hypothetical protein